MYPVRIEGARIVLRDFQPDDLDGQMKIAGDPAVTDSLSFDTRTRDEQAARLAADLERAKTDPRPDYYLAVVEKSPTEMIGFARIGLVTADAEEIQRSGELGVAICGDRWRQGFAIEAATLILDFAFSTLGLHRVQAACGPANIASKKGLERLGFRYEARIRDHVFTNGAWRDSLLYSILDHEWQKQRDSSAT